MPRGIWPSATKTCCASQQRCRSSAKTTSTTLAQKLEPLLRRIQAREPGLGRLHSCRCQGRRRRCLDSRRSTATRARPTYASCVNNQAIAKQISILENRLDKALKKYNEALAHNKKLRENIDNLRRERLVFDNIYKKFAVLRNIQGIG